MDCTTVSDERTACSSARDAQHAFDHSAEFLVHTQPQLAPRGFHRLFHPLEVGNRLPHLRAHVTACEQRHVQFQADRLVVEAKAQAGDVVRQ